MATYNTPLITTQGLSLLKAEIAGNDSVTFTKIVFSSDDYSQTSDSSVQALTALSSLDLTATARSFTDVNGNLKIRGVANNQNTTSAFYIKTYGLYGKNKAGNEMLIAVSTAQNANFVPAYNNKQTNQIAYTFNIAVSSTNNITLSSSTDVDVTQSDLAGINNAVNSNASSLTAQQSSYASSATSAISSNASNIANNSNNISSLQSSVSSNSSAIASNANNITSLQSSVNTQSSAIGNLNSNALLTLNNIPTGNLANISVDGIYSLGGNTFADAPYPEIYGTLIQYGSDFGVKTQLIITNLGAYYYRVVNSWGIEGWFQLASKDQINSISSSVASNSSAISSITSNASQYRGAIEDADNATNPGTYNTNEKTVNIPVYGPVNVGILYVICEPNSNLVIQLFSPMWHSGPMNEMWFRSQGGGEWQTWHKIATADDISNVQSSVSANSSAIANASSSLASAVSTNSANIATNSGAISSLQSSVSANSTTASQAINQVNANISSLQSQVTNNNVVAMNYKGTVPSTTLSNVWQTGYYDLGGQMFTDGPYGSNVAMYGQMTIMTTGGVTTQQIIDNGGGFYTRALNSWGITAWVKH